MVRTPHAHLGPPSLSPPPLTPAPPVACSWLGAAPPPPGAVLGSLCTRGAWTCTRGLAGPHGTQPCPAPQPLPQAASVTLQGGHRPGPRIRAGHGGTPRLSRKGCPSPKASKGPPSGPWLGVRVAPSPWAGGWRHALSAHWRGAGSGSCPGPELPGRRCAGRSPCRSWRGEGPARSCSGGGQV